MNIFDVLVVAFSLGTFFALEFLSNRRVEKNMEKLLDRLFSKDIDQYKYYQDKWKGDLKELERVREEAHKPESQFDDMEKEIKADHDKAKTFDPKDLEEDWPELQDEGQPK